MYQAKIDVHNQRFIITDDDTVIAVMPMPFSKIPNPGYDFLMAQEENQDAYDKILVLVEAANRGEEHD